MASLLYCILLCMVWTAVRDLVIAPRWPCKCGRYKLFAFGRIHPKFKTWLVMLDVWLTIAVVFFFVWNDQFTTPICWFFWDLAGLIAHEKDKIKRAGKATGKVIVDAFGRLRVHVPVPVSN